MVRSKVFTDDLPDGFELEGDIAVDTEAMGLNIARDRLCVVQISNGDGNAYLVHFSGKDYSAPNLCKLLSDQDRVKIFHYARFDAAILKQYLGVYPEPLYCTKIASKLARTYTDSHGLKDLCGELLSVKLSKQQQCSNWGREKLLPEQIAYAASDVLHLHDIRDKLNLMLENCGRKDLAHECFRGLASIIGLDLAGFNGPGIFEHFSVRC